MAAAPPPRSADPTQRRGRIHRRLAHFWQRLSDGLEVQQLWNQFRSEARSSYELYRQDVRWEDYETRRPVARGIRIARDFFWAIVLKLSPARRVALVLVLLLAWLGKDSVEIRNVTVGLNFRDWGFLLLFVLFVLELADRVTMKRDLQIAREIQHWLLPEAPPRLPGLDISFTTRPANTVSGDYYDAFLPEPDGNRLLLVVADVAGKSVPAALLMASFQASLHAYAHDSDGPLSLARRLNQFACTRSLDGQRFTTAFLAQLDLKTRTIYYVNAGHNPPVLRRAGGEVERLEVGGLPFGIRHDETYEAGKTNLLAGDLLFVFTDGVIEAVNEEEQVFGEARLLEALSSLERESAEGTIRSLMARIDRFVGDTRQSDDITCLAMRVE